MSFNIFPINSTYCNGTPNLNLYNSNLEQIALKIDEIENIRK